MFIDIKQVPIDDEMVKGFSVSEPTGETTTDCTEMERTAPSQFESELANPLPLVTDTNDWANEPPLECDALIYIVPLIDTATIGSGDVKPSGSSKRDGTASSPEPPVAIVGMIVLLLLLLLYGRRPFKGLR